MKKILFVTTMMSFLAGGGLTQAATSDVSVGKINFYGVVTEESCTISVDGKNSDTNIYLSPISMNEINSADTLLKPKSFTIDVSHCQSSVTGSQAQVISVSWIGGNSLVDNNKGYLANSNEIFGAKNIQFALSTGANLSSDKKIIPGDSGQPKATGSVIKNENGVSVSQFTYYVGYVTSTPSKVKSGQMSSYAIYQVTYE